MPKSPKVNYKVNLTDVFGQKIPNDSALREAIGGAIIDRIRERTQSGIDKNGSKFKKYSEAYKASLEFKAYGKSPGQVDLTLTGDMLGELDIINQTPQTLTFGWKDDVNNAKAYNHTTGDTVPKRDFLGLPKKDLDQIKNEFADTIQNFDDLQQSTDQESFRQSALKALSKLLE